MQDLREALDQQTEELLKRPDLRALDKDLIKLRRLDMRLVLDLIDQIEVLDRTLEDLERRVSALDRPVD